MQGRGEGAGKELCAFKSGFTPFVFALLNEFYRVKKIRLLVFAFVFKGDSCFLELRERLGDYKAFSANKKQGTGRGFCTQEGLRGSRPVSMWISVVTLYIFFIYTSYSYIGLPWWLRW